MNAADKPDSVLNRSKSFGLATRITLPFVALIALLLLTLGIVLAREMLSEVDSRVDNFQRFVLEIANYKGFALNEGKLRDIRDCAAHSSDPVVFSEFVVIESEDRVPAKENTVIITTLPPNDQSSSQTLEALKQSRIDMNLLASNEAVHRQDMELHGRKWLVLYTSRIPIGRGAVRRHVYLLYPYAEIEKARQRALWGIIAFSSLGLLLSTVLGIVIARWISRPVRRLAEVAKLISAGGLDEPLELSILNTGFSMHPSDEIGELTQAFQTMVANLRTSQLELLKAERLAVTGKLAACVAHEIRNPLTSMRMTVELLQQRSREEGAETREAYKVVLNEIDRLALAVDELLTFAHPRKPQCVPTDLNRLATDTLAFLKRQLTHSRVQAEADLDANLPFNLMLDPNKMKQLLVNLILNAQQAIVREGIIVVRTVWNAAQNQVLLSVRDSGPGIPEEVREKLFELFVTTKTGGGGIGLAIARQIAEEHGGTISFTSSPKNTEFTVTLPGRQEVRPD